MSFALEKHYIEDKNFRDQGAELSFSSTNALSTAFQCFAPHCMRSLWPTALKSWLPSGPLSSDDVEVAFPFQV